MVGPTIKRRPTPKKVLNKKIKPQPLKYPEPELFDDIDIETLDEEESELPLIPDEEDINEEIYHPYDWDVAETCLKQEVAFNIDFTSEPIQIGTYPERVYNEIKQKLEEIFNKDPEKWERHYKNMEPEQWDKIPKQRILGVKRGLYDWNNLKRLKIKFNFSDNSTKVAKLGDIIGRPSRGRPKILSETEIRELREKLKLETTRKSLKEVCEELFSYYKDKFENHFENFYKFCSKLLNEDKKNG